MVFKLVAADMRTVLAWAYPFEWHHSCAASKDGNWITAFRSPGGVT